MVVNNHKRSISKTEVKIYSVIISTWRGHRGRLDYHDELIKWEGRRYYHKYTRFIFYSSFLPSKKFKRKIWKNLALEYQNDILNKINNLNYFWKFIKNLILVFQSSLFSSFHTMNEKIWNLVGIKFLIYWKKINKKIKNKKQNWIRSINYIKLFTMNI